MNKDFFDKLATAPTIRLLQRKKYNASHLGH